MAISRQEFDDMLTILIEAHRWKLSDATLSAYYEISKNVEAEAFHSAFSAGLTSGDGFYKAADFFQAIRQSIRQAKQGKVVRALPAGSYQPCPDGLARLRRHVTSMKEAGKGWACSSEEFRESWAKPLSDEDMANSEGATLQAMLEVLT